MFLARPSIVRHYQSSGEDYDPSALVQAAVYHLGTLPQRGEMFDLGLTTYWR